MRRLLVLSCTPSPYSIRPANDREPHDSTNELSRPARRIRDGQRDRGRSGVAAQPDKDHHSRAGSDRAARSAQSCAPPAGSARIEAAATTYLSTLRSSMQDGDTPFCDTTRTRLAQATELLELARNQTRPVVDPADPWRGLCDPSRLPARDADGEIPCHPDVRRWSDGREGSLRPLFLAQGFDLQFTFGDFTEEAVEPGDHRCWEEMRAWQPTGPGADWRLVWLGDTEDGPAAWFVRPLAIAAFERRGITHA